MVHYILRNTTISFAHVCRNRNRAQRSIQRNSQNLGSLFIIIQQLRTIKLFIYSVKLSHQNPED